MSTRESIREHVAHHGAVAVREHRAWTRMLSRLAAEGELVRWLPGVYVTASTLDDVRVRCAALMLWDPDAVITGRAAAHLGYWPSLRVDEIEIHSARKKWSPRGVRVHRSRVPEQDVAVRDGLRVARSAWSAVHLAAVDQGEAIDTALRVGAATVGGLRSALARSARRWGASIRRPVVDASRTNPWSPAERLLHKIFRDGGISGWTGNLGCDLGGGRVFLDVAFPSLRIAIEVDGRGSHADPGAFERDRARQNALYVEQGWIVLRFTWLMLQDPAAVIETVKNALRRRRRELRPIRTR